VADAVAQTDPVEGDGGGMPGEPAGEDLAVVREDLLGHPVAVQAFQERIAYGSSGGSCDQLGDHAEPRVIIDPGDGFQLGAVIEQHATHHIHLP
jgi:hypothetical protein